jgi:hypothetical protein
MEGSGIVDSIPGQLGPDTLVNSAAGAAGALAGWAISSLGKTVCKDISHLFHAIS